ncbi:23S rRNA (adenine(2030)-N(6))-methyltransferase RlmJ [Marivivens donghaensis]|uniref:23S rRNA (adenine(2030)-N(6))-methyltransferase RlmJ n=1 Tax=Marivivens donghaensis TaxID=1699413 RepID=UPI00201EBCE6|nr:23S rRNA (adenine(2030)-N(6))-methyltransferase RlmJ [Marivivens donghaensis]MCL7408346.1 23S rRNA (adenine(2030)-N(6))-methyltransferase RlmJ [Marivivens donghaensis]MDN3704883.1 23S rRNA (adenine(2030)-N(6))-methyltransferase RlmJ [Marivivens donghaensis]
MLSYQHIYHAGNLADVQKHALLAWVLAYLTKKDKPLTYVETHAGRGLYDLGSFEALKTGEAAAGIAVAEERGWFAPDHPFAKVLKGVRDEHGRDAYPGSPLVAAGVLRAMDNLQLAELHPKEFAALDELMAGRAVRVKRDGVEYAKSILPPEPRRGVLLVDPPYEIKDDYKTMADLLVQVHKKWNVGVLMLWYPILKDGPHKPMLRTLEQAIPDGIRHEVKFPPARDGHRMIGSGMFVVNAPFGFTEESARLSKLFGTLA